MTSPNPDEPGTSEADPVEPQEGEACKHGTPMTDMCEPCNAEFDREQELFDDLRRELRKADDEYDDENDGPRHDYMAARLMDIALRFAKDAASACRAAALGEAVAVVRRYETSLRASVDRARDMFTACREDIARLSEGGGMKP